MRKKSSAIAAGILLFTMLSGCTAKFNPESSITVISREQGSGTRGAFIELFGIEQKDASGEKIDHTVDTADINDSTGIVLTSVSENKHAIGYISMGALNDSVKALKIDGAEATDKNIDNGTYKIFRPFNIATKGDVSEAAKDFIAFILSDKGQKVVGDNGYIKINETAAYNGIKPSGKIVVAGSSSVTPVMEKLKEAYLKINTNAVIEIQQSDSTTGMNSAIEGICDIGMASRELKDSELEKGLKATVIANDGIAVIVNNDNTLDGLTANQVKDIYTGKSVKWADVMG